MYLPCQHHRDREPSVTLHEAVKLWAQVTARQKKTNAIATSRKGHFDDLAKGLFGFNKTWIGVKVGSQERQVRVFVHLSPRSLSVGKPLALCCYLKMFRVR
jgi:hypothetical protein